MSSSMPDRYIDRERITEEETMHIVRGDEIIKMTKENHELQEELGRMREDYQKLLELEERREQADKIMNRLIKHPKIIKLIQENIQ